MTPNPFLGVFLHWLGGLASGSFYVPYKGVKKWAWETYWLVGGFFSWIICPWVLASLLSHDVVGLWRADFRFDDAVFGDVAGNGSGAGVLRGVRDIAAAGLEGVHAGLAGG